ncbi:MAG: carboxypeptidase-like regulatory domain-containing protein [Limnoraphis robusta]|uniref:carboxypeptidase-like regulatory domain-containing protein n=1 Tax=Limnoraphis robusta TaxID=1118279 RepID=UPI002B20B522|nr:carboxypeptidase-like regulatory domain-containing protein [Limnoraphis robusta]MEA5543084.1 carboxypeptidase-like regulatory domain-containing protein [Limnoraphis robusta Tam1]
MKWQLILGLVLFSSLGLSEKALAHGVKIEHNATQAIEINAKYDTGAPLENAQVTVYAPDDPTTPWKQGTTDNQGNFMFTPDPSKIGYWEVKVRQAGHGGLISIAVGNNTNNTQVSAAQPTENQNEQSSFYSKTSQGLSPIQKGLMIGSILWGCVGTALFFSKLNLKHSPVQDTPNVRQQESES